MTQPALAPAPAPQLPRSALTTSRPWAERALGALLVVIGGYYFLTGLLTALTFAWPQPAFDQFRLYPLYLELPFPENILQRENGHRPIVPGLFRYAEILWLDGNQWLQIGLGLVAASLTALLVAAASWRASGMPLAARAAGAAAALIAVFWLGNARMLLHGNELIHAYPLTLCVVVGALCVWQATLYRPYLWMAGASVAAVIATFCFGPGMACFPAFALAAYGAGVRVRSLAIPLVAMVACLVLYVAVLPGDAHVRDSLALRPVENVATAARWLASPVVNAWTGFAEPPLNAHSAGLIAQRHGWLVGSAQAIQTMSGLRWATGQALVLGFLGLAVLFAWVARAVVVRRVASPLEVVGGVLMMFGAASALIIGVGRLQYFEAHPDQIFADRYLIWPCLFWLGAVLILLVQTRATGRVTRPIAVVAVVFAAIVLWPTHRFNAGWGAAVYQLNQRTAAAARSDVLSTEVFTRDDSAAPFEDKMRSLALFRERHLAMFAQDGSDAIGTVWTGALDQASSGATGLTTPRLLTDERDGSTASTFSGVLEKSVAATPDLLLLVLDNDNRIVGYAQPTGLGQNMSPLRWSIPTMRAFDAFIRRYDPTKTYRLVRAEIASHRAEVLALVPGHRAGQ